MNIPTVSWHKFCLGRISAKWTQAAKAYYTTLNSDNWASMFIFIICGSLSKYVDFRYAECQPRRN